MEDGEESGVLVLVCFLGDEGGWRRGMVEKRRGEDGDCDCDCWDGCEWIRTVCSREEREGEVCTGRFVLVFMTAETDRHGMWNATGLDSYSKYSKYSKVNKQYRGM